MIQLFFTVIFAEMAVIMVLLFKTPLRKLVILCLDRAKRDRGPVVVKTVGGTISVVLLSSVFSMMKIQKRYFDDGGSNPTDQVLMSQHLLEASLMGFSLFLGLMIDRLHHYIRELRLRRKAMEAEKKQSRSFEDDGKNGALEEEMKALKEEKKALKEEKKALEEKVKHLQSEYERKQEEVKAAEANTMALKKQAEGFLLERDRLLEENQNIRKQLESI